MRPFIRKQFCKIASDRSNITSDGRHLSSDGPSYRANLPDNFALASYPLRNIHVLLKDEVSKKFSSRRRSSACYNGSRRYINIRTPVYRIYSSLNLRPVCDQSSDLLSCVQTRTTRLLCKEQRSPSKVMHAHCTSTHMQGT